MLFIKSKDTERVITLKKSSKTFEINVTESDDNDSDSSYFSLAITPSGCYSDMSKWVLDTGSTYHICPKSELFANFEELDGSLMSMGDDHICRLVSRVLFISRCMMG